MKRVGLAHHCVPLSPPCALTGGEVPLLWELTMASHSKQARTGDSGSKWLRPGLSSLWAAARETGALRWRGPGSRGPRGLCTFPVCGVCEEGEVHRDPIAPPRLTNQFSFCPTQGAARVLCICRAKLASARPTGLRLTLGDTQGGSEG